MYEFDQNTFSQDQGPLDGTHDPQVDEKLNYLIDELCDDYCERNDQGIYVIKQEY